MKRAEAFCQCIDAINKWTGKIVAWTVVPMTTLVVIDVTLRYIFNRPTIWVWDINVQLLAVIGAMGMGYTLLQGGHIGVDIIVTGMSRRKRAFLDLFTSLLFFCGIGVMMWKLSLAAGNSIRIRETINSVFAPPLYPLKVVIAIGIALLLLQGIARFIRDFNIAVTSKGAKQP